MALTREAKRKKERETGKQAIQDTHSITKQKQEEKDWRTSAKEQARAEYNRSVTQSRARDLGATAGNTVRSAFGLRTRSSSDRIASNSANEAEAARRAMTTARWTGDQELYDEAYRNYMRAMDRAEQVWKAEDTARSIGRAGADALSRLLPGDRSGRQLSTAADRLARDEGRYTRMAETASRIGSQEGAQRAVTGINSDIERYNRALDDYNREQDEKRASYMDRLYEGDRGGYYAETLTRRQIDDQLRGINMQLNEAKKAVADPQVNHDLYQATPEDYANNPSRLAYERVKRLEEQKAIYERARSLQVQDEMLATLNSYAPRGYLRDELKEKRNQGKARYEADQAAAKQSADAAYQAKLWEAVGEDRGVDARALRRDMQDAGYFLGVDEAQHLRTYDMDVFYALYAEDPARAKEWLQGISQYRTDANTAALQEAAGRNVLTQAGAMVGGTALRMASGVVNLADPFGSTARELSRKGNALISGGAQGLNEWSGTVDENIPVLGEIFGGKGLGDLYSLGSSILESTSMAAIAGGAGSLSKVVSALGVIIMGSSAAVSDYEDSLRRGLTEEQATRHALAAGINEAAFEWISLDKLVDPGEYASWLKRWLTQKGIEASEEFCTSVANRISDGYNARRGGYDTQIEQRMKELMALGTGYDEAKEKATKEWYVELITDTLGGWISGGADAAIVDGGRAIVNRTYGAYQNRINNERTGALSSRTGEASALAQYAADNKLEWTSPEQPAAAVKSGESGTQETDASAPAASSVQNDVSNSTLGRQVSEVAEQKKTRKELRQERKESRQIGADVNRVRGHIQEQMAGKTVQEQQTIRDELVEKYGSGMEMPVYRAVTMETAKKAMKLESTDAIRQARETDLAGLQDADMKRAVAEGYDFAAHQKAAQSGDLNAAAKYVQQVRNTGRGEMSMTATVTGEDGQSRQVNIVDMTEDGKSVMLEDGTVVAAKDLVADADTMDVVKQLARLNLGPDAGAVLQAYRDSGVEGANGYRWIMDYATAYEQGRMARISLQQAVDRSSLDAQTVMDAYTMGQQYAQAETEKAEARRNKARKKGVTGRKSNIDTSELTRKGITYEKMTRAERQQYDLANKIFELIGVDLKWIASDISTDSKGQEYYSGVNGSYLNGVVTLDIHAGQNYVEALRSGVLATTGHELTHFLEQYAPTQYKVLKEFLFQQIVEKGANGELTLERMIWEKQKRSNSRISAREAEHEVVADACQEMLLNSEAIREFAEENEEAAKGMARWVREFFGKIKAAFRQSTELTEQARFVAGLEKDVRKAFGKLWDEALREAVKAHDEIGNLPSKKNTAREGGKQFSIRPDIRNELTEIRELKRAFGDELLLGTTSDFLVNEIGYDQHPFYMAESKLYRVMVSEEQAKRDKKFRKKYEGSYHDLGVETTARILEQSETPLAAFQDTPENGEKRTDRIVLVTDVEADGGLGVVVVEPGKTARVNGQHVAANKSVTVFGKTLAKQQVRSAYEQNRLLYIDKNNGHIFNSGGKGAIYPTSISEDARKSNIQHYWADVNWVNEKVEQKSFGDDTPNTPMAEALKNWGPHSDRDYTKDSHGNELSSEQREYFKGSKAVDKDGNLLVLYRGKRGGETVILGDYRGAIWTTTDPEFADRYGVKDELYANIKNPYYKTVYNTDSDTGYDIDQVIHEAKDGGHDGAIISFTLNPDAYTGYVDFAAEKYPNEPAEEILKNWTKSAYMDAHKGETIGEFWKRAHEGPVSQHVVVFSSEQIKRTDNKTPTADRDIRYSDRDTAYLELAKDPQKNQTRLQEMVDEAAQEAGYIYEVWHGTNGGDFTVFDWGKTQRADAGWYGRGHYFATHKGEASAYGERVIHSYLRIKNPFNFQNELLDVNGQRLPVVAQSLRFMQTMGALDPAYFGKRTLEAYDNWSDQERSIKWADIGKEITAILDGMKLREYADGHCEWAYDYGGWTEESTKNEYATPEAAEKAKEAAAYELLQKRFNARLPIDPAAYYLGGDMDAADRFSEVLKKKGYDGVLQGTNGDEIVVFDSPQIKSADPVTYDDAGNVIPLSERFNQESEDIRYSDRDVAAVERENVALDLKTESAAPMDGPLYSERTWTASRFVQDRENAAKALAKALGVTEKKAKKYIDDINSVAKEIADHRARLDYMSSPGRSAFKSNAEYGGSIDFSTLCKKRQLLTGTFNAIQHALANTVLTAEDVLRVRQMMQDAGLEVNCGMCYVEGSRARMGEYNKTFLELYRRYFPDNWQPKMEDVNTTDGLELMRMEHPEAYEQYEYFYNNHGTLRSGDKAIFSSQAKPKEYQLRTEYNGEIRDKFQKESNVEAKNRNGGLRMQSFSDFEIVHLIDCMQVIMDMSEVGLAGQAYTKVPEFAEALGKTGLKINLSLVAKGVDSNGKLIYNDVEGMPHERAFGIRDNYSENVGTIIVVYDDAQLIAAMAEDKVDFIIPFHRSQWRKSQYAAMGLPSTTKDYTYQQNEKWLNPKAHTHEYRGRTVPTKATNYMPNEYWDFNLSGKQNAEKYLEMCARDGKRPKFYKLLQNNGDGTFSLKADGSTDGYWKLLIDFKMYDNNGVGVPQQPVRPIFDMDNAMRMLDEYSGDPSRFPVAQGIVDEFVSQYKKDHPRAQYSMRDYDNTLSDYDLIMGSDGEGLVGDQKTQLKETKERISQVQKLRGQLAQERVNAQGWERVADLSAKQLDMIKEKRKLEHQLEQQIQREEAIITGKLKPLPMQRLLKAEREKAEAKVAEHKDEVFRNYKERRSQTAMRNRIKNLHAEMQRELLKPREGHYVPQGLVKPVLELLEMVNTQTNREKSESAQARIDAINAQYDRLKSDERYAQYYDETVKGMLVELSTTLEGRSIYDLSTAELEDVYTAMKAMRTTIRNAVKADLVEKGKEIWEIGNALRQELRQGKGAHAYLLEKYHMGMLNAQRAFNRFGGYHQDSTWNKVYRMLDNAQLDMLRLEMEATRLFDPVLKAKADFEKAQALTSLDKGALVDVGLRDENGKSVWITRGMMLSLYMHLQNEDNMRHLMYGGLTLPDMKRYYKGNPEAWGRGTVSIPALGARVSNLEQLLEEQGEEWVRSQYKSMEEDIKKMFESVRESIEKQMTDYDRKWIAASRSFFDDFSRRELNRVTNSMYGFSKAKVDNYFPIVTDSDFLRSEFDSISRNISLENAGFMKERVRAANPLLLEDITRAVNRQISNVSRYAGLTEALKTFGSIYNVQSKGFTDSVKKAMAKSYGKNGQQYIENLITDMVGGRSQPGSLFDRIKGNYAQAVLSANLSVTIKQAASYPTAAATVGWKPLAKALAKGGRNGRPISRADRALIDTYSPLLWKRSQGAIDTEIGDMAHAQDWTKKAKWLMGWIEGADIMTVGRLWYAAEYYVKDNFKGLEKGSEAQIKAGESPFYQKVAEIFNRIVEETQPNYTVLQRPDILRNPNKLLRSMVMFSTQRFQNGQILMDAVSEYAAMRSWDKRTGTAESKAARQQAKTKLTWAITSQAVSAVVLNVMTWLAGAVMHRMNPWRDDDDEITWESRAETFAWGWLESMAGSFLAGSELFEALKAMMTGSTYYGNDVGGLSSINDFASALVTTGQQIIKLIGDEDSTPEDWTKLATKQLWKVGEYLSQMTGVPVANVRKILEGGRDHIIDAVNGEFLSYEAGVERKAKTNASRYLRAWIDGNLEKVDKVEQEMRRNYTEGGKSEEDANKDMKTKLTAAAKEAFAAGTLSEQDAIDFLTETGFYGENDAWDKAREWQGALEHKGEEGYKWNKYEDLREAFSSGSGIDAAIKDLQDHGYTEKQLSDEISDNVKSLLADGSISEEKAIDYMIRYRGMDENKAWKTVQEWQGQIEHQDEEDYSWGKYDDIDAALASNKDIKGLVKELTDHGEKEDNTSDHIKQQLIQNYVDGKTTETALKNQLSRYLGIVTKTDVDKILKDANTKKLYGVAYSSLDEEYRAGNITQKELKSALMKQGGMTSGEADLKIRWYDLQKANPDLDISESICNNWYDGTTGYTQKYGRESAKAAGFTIEAYVKARKELDQVKDANGNGTGEDEVIAALARMNLTARQKDALYYERYKGGARKGIYKTW